MTRAIANADSAIIRVPSTAKKDDIIDIIEEGVRANPNMQSAAGLAEYFDTRASPVKRTSKPVEAHERTTKTVEAPEEEKVVRRRKTITKTEPS
jgi:hypothetical protein